MPLALDFLHRVINVKWGEPQNFLMAGTSGAGVAMLLGSKDGTAWKTMPAPSASSATGAAYVKDNWFVTTNGPSVGKIYRSRDGVKTWQQVYVAATNTFDGTSVIAAGIPKAEEGKDQPKPTVVAINNSGGTVVLLVSSDLGDSWQTKSVSAPDTTAYCASFANGLFFVGLLSKTAPPSGGSSQKAELKLMVSENGNVWETVSVLSELSDLSATDAFGDPRYMFDGFLAGVVWNGDKDNPQYIFSATGYWVSGGSAVAIATSPGGHSWSQTGGPFGEWDAEFSAPGFGPYESYENYNSIISAGRVRIEGQEQPQTRVVVPAFKYSSEAPATGPYTVHSADAGMFISTSGSFNIRLSGTIPNVSSPGTQSIGVLSGPSAFGGGNFVYVGYNLTTVANARQLKTYVAKESNTTWTQTTNPFSGGNATAFAIGVGLIPDV